MMQVEHMDNMESYGELLIIGRAKRAVVGGYEG